ncbi:hypothetical protein NQZ68_002637 [Dissostichus eleginoides]|nr:hypothetical protein NQZ68_002637 [Dissostichus eleginoides]
MPAGGCLVSSSDSGLCLAGGAADKAGVDPPPHLKEAGASRKTKFPPIKSSINLQLRELIESGEGDVNRIETLTLPSLQKGGGDQSGLSSQITHKLRKTEQGHLCGNCTF